MMANSSQQSSARAFELKGGVFTLTVLHLWQWSLDAIAAQLTAKVGQAPDFFHNVPLVIDLETVKVGDVVDFPGLVALLRRCGFIPVAVRNAAPELEEKAAAAGLGALPKGKAERASRKQTATQTTAPAAASAAKFITHPVRSGQQVYAPGGDLIVLSSVSPGAELLADGCIHVYGVLRGRALAGVRGDTDARIFCQGLEADLVSVAGHYKLMEDLDAQLRGKPAQIYLKQDRLKVEAL